MLTEWIFRFQVIGEQCLGIESKNSYNLPVNGHFVVHSLLKDRQYNSWDDLHNAISAFTTEDLDPSDTRYDEVSGRSAKFRGDIFEQFSYFYFLYHKDIYNIEEIWCDKVSGREIPASFSDPNGRYKIGGAGKSSKDYGTDLVAKMNGREEPHLAIQAKFSSDPGHHPSYRELATFWRDAELFEERRIITSSMKLSGEDMQKPGPHIYRSDLLGIQNPSDFFTQLHDWANETIDAPTRKQYDPRPHQQEMIDDVVSGFENESRGKLLAACGTGKTLTALWIAEHQDMDVSSLLFLAPTIELTSQTFKNWAMQQREPFEYLIVCSDDDAAGDTDEFADIHVSDSGVSVTTDQGDIAKFLDLETDLRKYIFSTYQSSGRIAEAMEMSEFDNFDLIIFDEAHRTSAKGASGTEMMQIALHDTHILASKRLFMTATERIQTPQVQAFLEKHGNESYSMDDESLYGKVFHRLTFGRAIELKLIADYRIVLAFYESQGEDVDKLLESVVEVNQIKDKLNWESVFQASMLAKALDAGEVNKVITFQNLVDRAIAFAELVKVLSPKSTSINTIHGYQGAKIRDEIKHQFGLTEKGVLTNVRCLSEGVDLPEVDAVMFCDERTSVIDLVQAVGRALRKPEGEDKIATILLPVPIPEDAETLDDIPWDESNGMATFHWIIQAMRDQDEELHEEVNGICIDQAKGRGNRPRGKRGGRGKENKIEVSYRAAPDSIRLDTSDFWDRIHLRIAKINKTPLGEKSVFAQLEAGQRKSEHTSPMQMLSDYSPTAGMKDECLLVMPHLPDDRTTIIVKRELKALVDSNGHNTAAMMVNIGAIKEINRTHATVTSLGLRLKENPEKWEIAVRNQIWLYQNGNQIRPYRIVLNLLAKFESLNYHEFLFGPNMAEVRGGIWPIEQVERNIQYLRDNWPNGLFEIPQTAYEEVTAEINDALGTSYGELEIFRDRNTHGNKFRYLKNALKVLPYLSVEEDYRKPISVTVLKDLAWDKHLSEAVIDEEYGSAASWWIPRE
jgi:superfamily II DNA or RNA helicase